MNCNPPKEKEAISTLKHLWNVGTTCLQTAGSGLDQLIHFAKGLSKLSFASSPGNVSGCVWVSDLPFWVGWGSSCHLDELALGKVHCFFGKTKKEYFMNRIILHDHAERSCWFTSWQIKCITCKVENGFLASLDSLLYPRNGKRHKAGIQ